MPQWTPSIIEHLQVSATPSIAPHERGFFRRALLNEWACRIPVIAIVLIGAAGVMKAATFDLFVGSLQSWQTLPRGGALPVAVSVVAAETAIAASWFLFVRRRSAIIWAAALFLFTVTGAYTAESVYAEPPDCLCFGPIRAFEAHQASMIRLILRNGALLGCLIPGFLGSLLCARGPRGIA